MKKIDFTEHIIREEVSHRGGGIEIDLSKLGFSEERMIAYQNYLGGGMLGKICSDCTIYHNGRKISHKQKELLSEIEEQLKRYFHSLTNHSDNEWESQTYEQNQTMSESAY